MRSNEFIYGQLLTPIEGMSRDICTRMDTHGVRLKEERARLAISQADFAALGGVARNAQAHYEKGERSPDLDYLSRLADAGVDVVYVLTGRRDQVDAGTLTPEESTLIENYRKAAPTDRAFLQRLGVLASKDAGK